MDNTLDTLTIQLKDEARGSWSEEQRAKYVEWFLKRLLEVYAQGGKPNAEVIVTTEVGPDGMQPNPSTVSGWVNSAVHNKLLEQFYVELQRMLAGRIAQKWPDLVDHLIVKIEAAKSPEQIVTGMRYLQELWQFAAAPAEDKRAGALGSIMKRFLAQRVTVRQTEITISPVDQVALADMQTIDGEYRTVT